MAKKTAQTLKKDSPSTGQEHNLWSFLTVCVNRMYNLIKLGHLFSVFIFVFLIGLIIILIKFPPDQIPKLVFGIGGFLENEKFYIVPLLTVLSVSIWGNIKQKTVYQKEISRLTEQRKILVHGLESEELKPLKNHTTSRLGMKEEGLE